MALVFKSLMVHRYRESDNQSRITCTLECDRAHWSVIRPKPQREPSVNIANKSIEGMINIIPTSKGTLSQVLTLVSGWISAFGRPYGRCLQADTQPDTLVDTSPCMSFLLVLYIRSNPTKWTHLGHVSATVGVKLLDILKNIFN